MHNFLSFTNNLHLPTFFNDIDLGLHFELDWTKMLFNTQSLEVLVTPWTATDNIKKHKIFLLLLLWWL